jgi:hemoglobin-like flavoprotein
VHAQNSRESAEVYARDRRVRWQEIDTAMSITKHPLFLDTDNLGSLPIDAQLIARLRASFESVRPDGAALAAAFYRRLFAAHPQLRMLFPADMTRQMEKLIAALSLVVDEMHRPDLVGPQLARLGGAHVAYGALPEHYPIVCDTLVEALTEVGHIDAEARAEWRTALERISAAMLRGARKPG